MSVVLNRQIVAFEDPLHVEILVLFVQSIIISHADPIVGWQLQDSVEPLQRIRSQSLSHTDFCRLMILIYG